MANVKIFLAYYLKRMFFSEKSKKEKSKKESVKEGKSGVGKSPADKSDKKDEAAKADAEKDKEGDEKKESGGDDKEKKEGEDKDKREVGDEKDKKEGDEAGGDKLPQTADVPQQTAMQLLKKELAIDPPELRFNKDGGVVRMILTNNLGTRVAVKVCICVLITWWDFYWACNLSTLIFFLKHTILRGI